MAEEETKQEETSTEEATSDEGISEKIEDISSRLEVESHVTKFVKGITFGMLSPKVIKKMAAAKIVTPELYDREGYPVDGGLMDLRLGVIDPGLKCKTDGTKIKEGLGHFGYIELARPVVHIAFVAKVLECLRCTCNETGKILLPKEKAERYRKALLRMKEEQGYEAYRLEVKEIINECKNITKSPHSKAKQPKIILEKPTTFIADDKRLSPIQVRSRLEMIPDEDLILLGLNPKYVRPEWMILTVLAIPPVTMRPSITLESGERSEDDLTHKLGDIVRINQRLFENINAGAPEIIIEDLWDLLQYHITTFFDNAVEQLPPARHRSGQPLKTITERIKSKEGRIRSNLAGKRTNFSARTVISPDPMIGIDEVGVPKSIAMKLTVPETVNPWNEGYLRNFIQKGAKEYPGCNYVIRPDGKKRKITDETKEQALEELKPGYIVERHLIDGDIAIFNRQPSLHRMSMMCHKVRILPGKTLRLNPLVCHPYNADFDGDEMNLHIPQTEEARAEAEILMLVSTQLISPRYGLSVIGCIQDGISGSYMLTKEGEYTRSEAVQLLMEVGVRDFSRVPNKQKISGAEVFSVIIPEDFSFKGKSRAKNNQGDQEVIIENGKLTKGVMDRNNLGEGSGLLLRNLHKKYGAQATMDILEKIFRLGIATLLKRGFTASISDSDIPADARELIETTLTEAEEQANVLIEQYHKGELEAFPGRTAFETLELKILELLNKTRNKTGEVVNENVDSRAHSIIMSHSGAKGGPLNLAQMTACVGQQAMRGGRIDKGYKDRTLSHFKKGDLSTASRGFIRAGFKKGLQPHEFFFAAMTGRDSLMDTALRTPKSGYLYRRLANAMQDLKVEYDFTVRDASNKIVQFRYGEDGVDVARSENGIIDVDKIIEEI